MITIVITLALGLRKIRAELRRRVNAWKELIIFADYAVPETIEEQLVQSDESEQEEVATPKRNRKSFHNRFRQWANAHGAETIRK